jgi:hypothetical protein
MWYGGKGKTKEDVEVHGMHALILGRAITGIPSFAPKYDKQRI